MLEIKDLCKSYGSKKVLKNIRASGYFIMERIRTFGTKWGWEVNTYEYHYN